MNFEGSGSKEYPYKIYNETDLRNMATWVNDGYSFSEKYFELQNDVVLSDEPWVPIGAGNGDNSIFSGIFDGKNHRISGMKIGTRMQPDSTYKTIGLFGVVSSKKSVAVIKNLSVLSEVYSKLKFAYMGCLVGVVFNKSLIENCQCTGVVEGGKGENEEAGNFPIVGGLVGLNSEESTVLECNSETLVAGGTYAVIGGLVGWNLDGKIRNCLSLGKTIGSDYSVMGGLAGYNSHEESLISNSFSGAKVIGGNCASIGGLVGWNTESTIKNSHSAGDVMGNSDAVIGGLVGWNKDGRVIGCCWNKEATHMNNGEFLDEGSKKGIICFDEGYVDSSKALLEMEIVKMAKGRIGK